MWHLPPRESYVLVFKLVTLPYAQRNVSSSAAYVMVDEAIV
jgi:hypothetical protein